VTGQKPRQIAAQLLRQHEAGKDFIENQLDATLAAAALSTPDRGLCQELVYGVMRWRAALDWLIDRKTAGRQQKPLLQTLLRLGLYQIFWLDRIPAHAAVHETVEQAKHSGFGPQSGFINAILRGYLRESVETRQLLDQLRETHPAVGWSHPEWLVERWQKIFDPESLHQLLRWNNTPPATFARINTLNISAEKILPQWREENVEYDFVRRDWLDDDTIFELKSHPPLHLLPSFQSGGFYVQDPSTLLAVRELDPQPGETILDFCAAPGGKATFIAQLMGNQGRVIAHDIFADRLKLIEENTARLGTHCIQTSSNADTLPSQCDRVLVDAPCSNTGVLRRRVDLRWRIRPEEVERLCRTQLDILQQAAKRVRSGGVLIYSTCSLEPEENAGLVAQFLATSSGFALERQRSLTPFADVVDGAFVARLRRA
jgi:16S rRNA (cytosine967-C5)-methyltransferase